ncbi:hypothetical protein AVEN_193444-1 [Araneus ventricosus]|uniref:DDE-1 domain-containing protein n=1 Tax=Araneus ventricosus TaxID=182803 RepID=A0A4Y2G4W5_ARAVE|nr:hypothetical protein AVEN_193444-1 [Araneus ventricosus]
MKRHNIVFRKLCGESASVDASSCEEWLSELPSLLKNYKADDVFNPYDTELFFRCLPNKTAAIKGEECHCGKQSKLRVTVLLAANQSGKITSNLTCPYGHTNIEPLAVLKYAIKFEYKIFSQSTLLHR